MGKPTFTQAGSSTDKIPKQEYIPKASEHSKLENEKDTHTDEKDHHRDNIEFLRALDAEPDVEKKKSLEKLKEWESKGNLDLLRAAGFSLDELIANPLARHIKLASMFLERDKNANGLVFTINFHGSKMAQSDIDLADILPPNNLIIDVLDAKGQLITAGAKREFKEGRPGYFDPKTKQRVILQNEEKIRIKETQSSMGIRDRSFGYQSNHNAIREEMYMVTNAQKTGIKDRVREDAAKQNKEVKTNKNFFDVFLTQITDFLQKNNLIDPKDKTKINFDAIEGMITGLLSKLGFDKLTPRAGIHTDKKGHKAINQPKQTNDKELSKIISSKEINKDVPNINREWLMQYVGRSNAEVWKKMTKVKFRGSNIFVCKYMAPYLIEADERMKKANVEYMCNPRETSCQNWRTIRGGKTLSMHSWGTAIDINSVQNPFQPHLRGKNGVKPKMNLPPVFINTMIACGFRWLGPWDPMHFELRKNPFKNKSVLTSSRARQAAGKFLV